MKYLVTILIFGLSNFMMTAQDNTFPTSGNVGIGTTTPDAKLKVIGAGTIGGQWNPSNSYLTISDGGSQSLIMDSNEIYGSNLLHIGAKGNEIVKFRTISDSGSAIDRMIIKSNGNVGIGTTNPTSILELVNSNSNRIKFNNNDTSSISFLPNNGDSHFHISHTLDNRLTISQGLNVGENKLFTIVNNGAVGIGTTVPDSKLTVKGNIHAEEVKVDLSVPGPDYVFKEDYDLKSLEEVQEYIQAHGHLPNIPSAKEMEVNGILLGGMNMKLLEKIEELTLYLIELGKENQLLQETIRIRTSELGKWKEKLVWQEARINRLEKILIQK